MPYKEPSSFLSIKSLTTKIVEEKASPTPKYHDSTSPKPKTLAKLAPIIVVIKICKVPAIRMGLPRLLISRKSSSIPIKKSTNAIPISGKKFKTSEARGSKIADEAIKRIVSRRKKHNLEFFINLSNQIIRDSRELDRVKFADISALPKGYDKSLLPRDREGKLKIIDVSMTKLYARVCQSVLDAMLEQNVKGSEISKFVREEAWIVGSCNGYWPVEPNRNIVRFLDVLGKKVANKYAQKYPFDILNSFTSEEIRNNKPIDILMNAAVDFAIDYSNDNTILKQDKGTTWNKFTDVAGISSYSVQTPTTIASVRGTEFEISSDEEASTLIVEEGEVDFKADNEEVIVKSNEKFMVKREKLKDRMTKKMEKLEMGLKDRERMAKRVEKNVKRMEKVKERVMRRAKMEEGKVKELFEKTKKGEISREEFEKRTKLKPNAARKVFEMDKKVNREVERVKQIKTIKEEVKEVRKDLKSKIENNVENRRLRYDEAKIRRRIDS